jgi:hypothetical protein
VSGKVPGEAEKWDDVIRKITSVWTPEIAAEVLAAITKLDLRATPSVGDVPTFDGSKFVPQVPSGGGTVFPPEFWQVDETVGTLIATLPAPGDDPATIIRLEGGSGVVVEVGTDGSVNWVFTDANGKQSWVNSDSQTVVTIDSDRLVLSKVGDAAVGLRWEFGLGLLHLDNPSTVDPGIPGALWVDPVTRVVKCSVGA